MKNQTLNYSRRCIDETVESFKKYGVINKCKDILDVLALLDKSVKFILPERGEIIEEFKAGELNESWKDLMYLPFDIATFEYPMDPEETTLTRRITMLFDLKSQDDDVKKVIDNAVKSHESMKVDGDIRGLIEDEESGRVFALASFFYDEDSKSWECSPSGTVLHLDDEIEKGVNLRPIVFNQFICSELISHHNYTFEDLFKNIVEDTNFDMWVAMQAMCVLNCENIQAIDVKVPAKMAKSRAKKGLKPLHDYKSLVISMGGNNYESFSGESKGGTKRTHLRRGHLRRLQNGKVTYVRSAIIGAQSKSGSIQKDYVLKKQK